MSRTHWIIVGVMAAGLVGCVFLGWRYLIQPQQAAYEAKVAEKADAEAKLKEAKERAAQFEKFQAEAENVRRDLEFYTRRLDEPLNREQLQATLDSMVNTFNLRNTTTDFETKPKGSGESTLVKLTFQGDLDHVGRLMDACVGQQHIFLFGDMDLRSQVDSSNDYRNSLAAEVNLEVLAGSPGGK